MKKRNIDKKKAGISLGLVVGLVMVMMFLYITAPRPMIEPTDDGKSWHLVWSGSLAKAAEGNPGGSGILGVYFVNDSTSNFANNDSSILETWATDNNLGFVTADNFNEEMAHSVDFDIVVRVRVNETQADDGAGNFNDAWIRVNISSPGAGNLDINGGTAMTKVVTHNDTALPYIWLNFNIKEDQAAGKLNLARDQSADITYINLSAYY